MNTLAKIILAVFVAGSSSLPAGEAAAPAGEAASPLISYDFVQGIYSHAQLDGGLLGSGAFEDQDGYNLSWQKSVAERSYAFGGLGQQFSSDEVAQGAMRLDGEMSSFHAVLGLGMHLPVTPGIHWVLQAGGTYNRSRVDAAGRTPLGQPYSYLNAFSSEGFGLQAATGFRMAVNHWLEVSLLYPFAWSNLDSEVLGKSLETEARAEHSVFGSVLWRKLGGGPLDLVITGLISESAERLSAGLRLNF